jgi:signal transduction histidine kinase/CheY-like chemotaxis protein
LLRSSTIIFHQLLVAAAIVVPATAFLAAAMENRGDVLREGEGTVVRTVAVLDEHARKVFDTVDLVLGRVDDRVRGETPEQIDAQDTNEFLRRLKAPLKQAVSIWVSDSTGRVLAGSQDWDRSVGISGRDFFAIHRQGERDTHISKAFVGKATNIASFAVSRARMAPDGAFAGTLHVAVSPDYFESFFHEAAPPGPYSALLFRNDGSVLAGGPDRRQPSTLDPASDLMRAIRANPTSGVFRGESPLDGVRSFYAYRRVAPYAVYVAFGLSYDAMSQRWYDNLELYGAVAGAASLFLLFLSLLALRRVRAEQAALAQVRLQSEQRLLAEQRLFQSQKMESIGQLTGGIAHDFNNLLAVILGNLGMLKKIIGGNERAERLLNGAIQGAERGATLTQRLLAFARRQELAPRSVDVPELVLGLMDLLRQTIGPGIEIICEMPEQADAALVDPNQLELAILNLAVNARDAMPEGGRITVALTAETLEAGNDLGLSPGDYLCLSITDTGVGMSPETLARASEPFFTTKEIGKGTGLGVSMVHGLALQSGGAFRMRSQLGKGARAEIWLPRSSAPAAHSSEAAWVPMAEPTRSLLLLVDDDDLVRETTSAILEERGFEIHQSNSAENALVVMGTRRFDLVVTDLVMPGMGGIAFAARLAEGWPDLPVLLVTGNADVVGQVPPGLPRLSKPFSETELAQAVERLLARAATVPS